MDTPHPALAASRQAGFVASANGLQQASDRLRAVRPVVETARRTLAQAHEPLHSASTEVSAEQIAWLLAPAGQTIDSARAEMERARATLPEVISAIAATAAQNPARPALVHQYQAMLPAVLQRLADTADRRKRPPRFLSMATLRRFRRYH